MPILDAPIVSARYFFPRAVEVANPVQVDVAGGLIIESGIADPLERILMRARPHELGATLEQLQEEAARFLDHRAKLAATNTRVLVMHAANDNLVLPSNAQRNAEWSSGELVLFERGDHNSIYFYNRDRILDEVARFVT